MLVDSRPGLDLFMVKLDVEGYEPAVIAGAERLLAPRLAAVAQ